MNILISGSTGLIGNHLTDFLIKNNHKVLRLVRKNSPYPEKQIYWNPCNGKIDLDVDESIDVVVHLAGESVGDGKWTTEKKEKILKSRIQGTKTICEGISRLKNKPKVIISASAIGYYGNRDSEFLTEESSNGNDFLAEVCKEWEEQTRIADLNGIRVVNIRIGIVLSEKGGALAKMLMPFKAGVGGILGNGKQFMSWIDIDDLVRLIYHTINNESLKGALNAVSPNPVRNKEFTKTLGKILKRPTIFPLPQFAGKFIFGEMGDALLFSSQNVSSETLLKSNFSFLYPYLETSLRHLLLNENSSNNIYLDSARKEVKV